MPANGVIVLAVSVLAIDGWHANAAPAGLQQDSSPAPAVAPFDPVNGDPPPKLPKGAFPPGPRPPDVLSRGPSIELALEMAQTAAASCAPQHVGVAILDADGNPKLYYIPDGTAGSHAYTGFRKAFTALHFKEATSRVHADVQTNEALDAEVRGNSNLVSWAGGVPITVNGGIIGAIGVSGAEPSEVDEACAVAAIQKVQSRLK